MTLHPFDTLRCHDTQGDDGPMTNTCMEVRTVTSNRRLDICPSWCTDHDGLDNSHGGDTVELFGSVRRRLGGVEAAVQLAPAQRADGDKDLTLSVTDGFIVMSVEQAEVLARTLLAQVALISGA